MNRSEGDLNTLFSEYRDAVEVPEASANFMPRLWDRIEARRTFAFEWKRVTRIFVGSAAAICLAFGGFMFVPRSSASTHPATYVDVLQEAVPTENLLAQGISRIEAPEGSKPEDSR